MSKEKSLVKQPGPNGLIMHLYSVYYFENHVGRVLTLIETLGLNEKQEKAFKEIIKQEIWDLWEHPWGTDIKKPISSLPINSK